MPKSLVNPTKTSASTSLSNFVTITDSPFEIAINSVDGTHVLDFKGMVLDSWLNIIKTELTLGYGDDFHGIFGLGEKI